MPLPPEGQVAQFDRQIADAVIRAAVFAADGEVLRKPVPFSSVRSPDGSRQPETQAERDTRMVRAAVLHLLEQGLVVFPDDILDTLDGWIPADRVGED
jgi:hypothetical protein